MSKTGSGNGRRGEITGMWFDEADKVPWLKLQPAPLDPSIQALLDQAEEAEATRRAQLSPRQLAKTVALEQNKMDLLSQGRSVMNVRVDPETKEFVYERINPDEFFSYPSNKSAK